MKQHMCQLLIIIVVIFILKINIIKCKRPHPWFMDDQFVYYVDIEPKYSSNYTQKACLKQQMIDPILNTNVDTMLPLLQQIYGDIPGLWTFKNDYLGKYLSIEKCFGLDIQSKTLRPKNCYDKMGFICKKRMKFAYLYKHNSLEKIEQQDIKKFCDPQAPNNRNNDVMACLVEFNF